MSNRRKRASSAVGESLDGLDQNELDFPGADLQSMSTTEFANAGYNTKITTTDEFESVGKGRINARPLEISRIQPDVAQPRRAVPSSLRQYWNGNPDSRSLANLFMHWGREIELERGGKAFDIEAYVRAEYTDRSPQTDESLEELPQVGSQNKSGAKEAALMRIIELASSILRDGLLNPISVAPYGESGRYVIETGERRWWAYQLLNWLFPDDGIWQKIPAQQVKDVNIWRQAGENNARSDLNAIARARQLALLVMTIYEGKGVTLQPFSAYANEQDFYAQVGDGGAYRVPANMMENILNATGLSAPTQVRQYRQLLRLPNPVWVLADDLSWTQSKIERDILQNAVTDDEKLRRAAAEANKEGYSVSILTLESEIEPEQAADKPVHDGKFTKYKKLLLTLRKTMDDLPTQQRDALLDQMETILRTYR